MSKLEDYIENYEQRHRNVPANVRTNTVVRELAELAYDEIESLKADIAALKVVVPPPRGFDSWKQFEKVTQNAFESQ